MIVATCTKHLTFELWEYTMSNTLLELFDKSVHKYIDQLVGFTTSKAREVKQKEISQALQTPTFSFGGGGPSASNKKGGKKGQGSRMKFDETTIQNFHQRSAQETQAPEFGAFGMAPEETPKTQKPSQSNIDDQNINLIVMKIVNSSLKEFNDKFVVSKGKTGRVVQSIWVTYTKMMSPLVGNASAELLIGVLETIDFMLSSDLAEYLYSKYDSVTLGLFEDINSLIQRKTDLVLTKQTTELLVKIYKQIFTPENINNRPQLLNPQNLSVALHIMRVNLIHTRPTMGLNAMRQDNDLKEEEKLIFNFIENLGFMLHDKDDALKYYLSFLLNFISYDADEPHYEMFVRRTFLIISEGITKDQYSPNILFELIPDLFTKSCEIVDLRYHNNSCMSLVFSMKSSASLFETAGLFLMQISSHILDKDAEEEPEKHTIIKPNLTIDIPDDGEGEVDIEIEERESEEDEEPEAHTKAPSSTLRTIDEEDSIMMSPSKSKPNNVTLPQVQDLILNKLMNILNKSLLFDITKIEKHNKAVKDSIIKSSQDLDVQVINFIINDLLPHAYKLGKKLMHIKSLLTF